MPGPVWTRPMGGISPFGKIVVATPGTPVGLNTNTGPQSQVSGTNATFRYKQVIVSAFLSNTKPVYVVYRSNSATGSPQNVFVEIPPGLSRSLPDGGQLQTSAINIDNLSLDALVAGEGAYAYGVYG